MKPIKPSVADRIVGRLNEFTEALESKAAMKMTKAARKRHLRNAGTDDMDELDYEEMDPVEDGSIQQTIKCSVCKRRWMDVFTLTEVHELCD